MKINYIVLALFAFIFNSCSKEERGQYPTDNVAPGEIKSPVVQNIAGGAIISYIIPDDEDLLYVKAIYTLDNGTVMEQKASSYTNSLTIEGFGKSRAVSVALIAGDRSKNESKPVIVNAHPLDAPIYAILASMLVSADFGGIRLDWQNPTQADVVIGVITPDSTGKFATASNFYTDSKIGRGNIRGYASVSRVFGIYIRDRWGNITDTLKGSYTPLFEQEIKGSFARFNPTGIPYTVYQTYNIENMWDGNPATFYLQTTTGYPWSFSFDMGKLAKLSRIKQIQRQGATLIYTSQNVRYFEIWGSATSNVTSSFTGWTKLGDFESHKPSGGAAGVNTAEDAAFALSGEDFSVDPAAPPVRYIRYVIKGTWSGDLNAAIGEMSFFGSL